MDQLQDLIVKLTQLLDSLWPFAHPKEVVLGMLNDSIGLLLRVWFDFILRTTDFESGGDFTRNSTIQHIEPVVQLVADSALVLVALWASYRIMWGHGLRSQYTARILLPRLFLAVILINFSLPMFQAVVAASNSLSSVVLSLGSLNDPTSWWTGFATAPLAGLLFTLPETHHWSKVWASHFVTNLLMQPAQLFVLAIGFALENGGRTPVHHLFALASLLIVFKVPGAIGGAEKAAHKLQSTVEGAFKAVGHAMAKA